MQAVPLTIPNGQVFTPAITGTVTLTFTTVNTFTLGGSAGIGATGVVTYPYNVTLNALPKFAFVESRV